MDLLTVSRLPTLEPTLDALEDLCTGPTWDAAAAVVRDLLPPEPIVLERPTVTRANADGFALPTSWPGMILIGHNLRREDPGDSLLGGTWRGAVELHLWLADDDTDRLVRSLHAAADVLWLLLVSADAERALAGARLQPETLGWNRVPDPGQSQAQQAVAMACEFTVTA